MKVTFARDCPNCKKSITYSSKQSHDRAIKEGRVCQSCRYILYPPLHNKGKKMEEEIKEKIRLSKIGKSSWNKGIPMAESSKKKLSESLKIVKSRTPHWNLGKKASPDLIKKLSESHLGKKSHMLGKRHSEKTKEKIRISLVRNIKERGFSSKYNPNACKFIDRLNGSMGWNLIHAGNGGETEVCGYFLDGYDEVRGIIFEYDEPKHHLSKKKEKDITRQNRILKHLKELGKEVKFYRYDERYNELYEVMQ